jgi:Ca-activated chloride channel family protein
VPPSRFDDCVLDVGLTGDEAYAHDTGVDVDLGAQITGPVTASAGSEFRLPWSGPASPQDFIAVAEKGAPAGSHLNWAYTRDGTPLTLRAPDQQGVYELRYVQARSRAILATGVLMVEAVMARLQVPSEVAAGSVFEVSWQGPDNPQDLLAVAERGAPEGRHLNWQYTRDGTPLTLRAPDEPGDYEVRYVMAQSNTSLASEALTVNAVTARLQVPSEVAAGSVFEVSWQGPDNPQDLLAVAERGAPEGRHLNWQYARDGTPLTLRAPDEPGDYEVRYVMAQSKKALVSVTLTVKAATN